MKNYTFTYHSKPNRLGNTTIYTFSGFSRSALKEFKEKISEAKMYTKISADNGNNNGNQNGNHNFTSKKGKNKSKNLKIDNIQDSSISPNISGSNSYTAKGNGLNTVDKTSVNKKSTPNFLGIRPLTNINKLFYDSSCGEAKVIHKINYFSSPIKDFIFNSLKIKNLGDYLNFISDKFYNSIENRGITLKANKIRFSMLLNSLKTKNFFYYLLNYFYLSTSVESQNKFKSNSGLKAIYMPTFFEKIISHLSANKIFNSGFEANRVSHIFDNSEVKDVINFIKKQINYPNIDDYTDDFSESYHVLLEIVDMLYIDHIELKSSFIIPRFIHTGLYSFLDFIGCDYFVALDEFMINLLFMKTVTVQNSDDSFLYKPELTTVIKEDSEHHINTFSINLHFKKFFNDSLGQIPILKIFSNSDSLIDDLYSLTSSIEIEANRKMNNDIYGIKTKFDDDRDSSISDDTTTGTTTDSDVGS